MPEIEDCIVNVCGGCPDAGRIISQSYTKHKRGWKTARNCIFDCHLSPVKGQSKTLFGDNFLSTSVFSIMVFDWRLSSVIQQPDTFSKMTCVPSDNSYQSRHLPSQISYCGAFYGHYGFHRIFRHLILTYQK